MNIVPDQIPELSEGWCGPSLLSHLVPDSPWVVHSDGHVVRFSMLRNLVRKQVDCIYIAVEIFIVS